MLGTQSLSLPVLTRGREPPRLRIKSIGIHPSFWRHKTASAAVGPQPRKEGSRLDYMPCALPYENPREGLNNVLSCRIQKDEIGNDEPVDEPGNGEQ
jgi:hypothetical protein